MHKFLSATFACLLLALCVSGCQQAPSTPTQPTISDYTYTNQFGVEGKWQVSLDERATVQVDADGSVTVTCNSSNSTYMKVSGTGVTFKVINARGVIVDDGATIYAYNCDNVKARNGSKVYAYGCDNVYALPKAEILRAEGCRVVNQLKEPTPVNPPTPVKN